MFLLSIEEEKKARNFRYYSFSFTSALDLHIIFEMRCSFFCFNKGNCKVNITCYICPVYTLISNCRKI